MPISEDALTVIRKGMRTVKTPTQYDKVFKDECMLTFENPFCEGGLFVSLSTWYGFGRARVGAYASKTQETLFLHESWAKVERPQAEEAPTKMAIGVDGGFSGGPAYDIVKTHRLAVVEPTGITFHELSDDLPTLVQNACTAVISSDGVAFKEDVTAWEDVDATTESKFAATLPQVENPPQISSDPSSWVCEESGQRENLWLNLSSGHIGGGRKYFDGTGGSGTAITHFEATGYPLVVKLGTITPHGADVYSYHPSEDRSCCDPKLAEHLAHFGIDIMRQEKTVKTTTELSVELNNSHDYSKITEGDKDLTPAYGKGFQGLHNLGNSCYMASVLQSLLDVPELKKRYVDGAESLLTSASGNPAEDVLAQTAKVASALAEGAYRKPGDDTDPAFQVHPRMFKSLIAKGHKEFSSVRQQDAQEYFGHLLDQLTRAETAGRGRLGETMTLSENVFTYSTVERVECGASGAVRYAEATGNMLKMVIPLSAATNQAEVEESQQKRQKTDGEDTPAVVPCVPFSALVERFTEEGLIQDFVSPLSGGKTFAKTSTRIKTFPKSLAIYLPRYYVTERWEPKKLDVVVDVPETIDLSSLRGTSELKPGEVAMPEAEPETSAPPAEVIPDETIMSQLLSMDFPVNGCKKACIATKNQSADAAMEWVFANMESPDFADPPQAQTAAPTESAATFSAESIMMLTSLGFTEKQAKKALKNTGGSAERAADWLFSHPDDTGSDEEGGGGGGGGSTTAAAASLDDGAARYKMTAMISHIGKNTGSGHYVAHVKKDGAWHIFNDEKVCESQSPPFAHAYIYLFRREDAE